MGLRDRLPPGPVVKYYLFMATSSAGLAFPVWVLFLRARGLSFTEIMVLDAVWWVGIVAGELPTGYVADRFGWRNSLVVGQVLRAVSVVAMGLSGTFTSLALVYLLWALGSTLQSGSRDAWLYEVLDRRLDADRFTRVRGRGQSIVRIVGAVGALAGGVLGAVDLRFPFLLTGGVWCLGVLVLLTLPRIEVDADDGISPLEALPVLRRHLLSAPLLAFVVWVAVLLGVLQAAARFTQPVTVSLGVSVAALGPLYAAFHLVAAAASYRAEWFRDRVGLAAWLVLVPLGVGVLFVGAWVVPLAALPAFFAIRPVRSLTETLANQHVNDRVETVGRATVLSGASMAYSLVKIPVATGSGALADATSPLVTMAVLGVALVGATAVAWSVATPVGGGSGTGAPAD